MGGEKVRGELGEIKTTLAGLSSTHGRAPELLAAKREVFKKIVNYMTVGIDMSSLFMQAMTAAVQHGDDIVLKKMLYLYICTYAQSNPDLTLLTINLLTKDSKDTDPHIRGLAIRSLCSLRVANLVEYLVPAISVGLIDQHSYVRRTAVMGVLKVYNIDKPAVHNTGMLGTLKEMLQNDPDAQVAANCITVLEKAGDMKGMIDRAFVVRLLNRIKEFSEWAQCQVLEAVSVYRPSNEGEVYDMMNLLDDRLTHSNSAVVMAAIKLFLHLTLAMPATHQQVLERVKDPMQTLISRDHFETAYAVLAHFHLLAQRAPILFSSIYTAFFCRMNEPTYIKQLKLEILAAIADEHNAYDIATELTEYVGDIDPHLARDAVRAVGRIALEVQDVGGIVERLLGFLEVGKPYVTAEAVTQIADLLRRFPDLAEICVSSVSNISPQDLEEPEAKAAFIWILGEFGHSIQDAPYLLERVAGKFEGEAPAVRAALLTATAKLFFKRPPECQRALGMCLQAAVADSDMLIHDRGLMYLRLLQYSVNEAARVIAPPMEAVTAFAEEQSPELRDRIFDEFNTLAVIFREPSTAFTRRTTVDTLSNGFNDVDGEGAVPAADEGSSLLTDTEQAEALGQDGLTPRLANGSPGAAPAASASTPLPDLLGDLLGGGGDLMAPAAPAAPQPVLSLRPHPHLTPQEFQGKWGALQPAKKESLMLAPPSIATAVAGGLQELNRRMAAASLFTMASGGAAPAFRCYLHGQTEAAE
ncbi:hypothetical protein WJX73_006669 [Symbiochloris irregularis]|uniref:AP complex subunit beta n=1 Tax=Symbiochloris irregularis TaxID=706552 RepID=A0AAW1NJT0_9CHLO